eukprot:3521090-Amphidinium_carterae.1
MHELPKDQLLAHANYCSVMEIATVSPTKGPKTSCNTPVQCFCGNSCLHHWNYADAHGCLDQITSSLCQSGRKNKAVTSANPFVRVVAVFVPAAAQHLLRRQHNRLQKRATYRLPRPGVGLLVHPQTAQAWLVTCPTVDSGWV